MFDEINSKLFALKDQIRIRGKVKSSLADVLSLLKEEERKLASLKAELEKESRDVEKLEGLSITGLFHSILGNKEEQHEKEKKEYLAAKLKFDNSINTVNILRKEKSDLELQLTGFGDIDKEYAALISEKEELLNKLNNSVSGKLRTCLEQINNSKLALNEIEEALDAGRELELILYNVQDSLSSAKGWGTWDLLGGGIIATAVKHSKIDEARALIASAQRQLTRFAKELNDVGLHSSISVDIGGFATFADYFFDNLIVDWIVQSKINDSLEQTKSVFYKVQTIVAELKNKKSEHEKQIEENEKTRLALVENS